MTAQKARYHRNSILQIEYPTRPLYTEAMIMCLAPFAVSLRLCVKIDIERDKQV
jgi:hypothetical protein